MKFDRRLTNGLAWAGALLVVGVPAADYLASRLGADAAPHVAVVETPDNVAAEPAPVNASLSVASEPAAVPQAPPAVETPRPAPVEVADVEARERPADAVQSYLDSGRALPSYITGEGAATPPVSAIAPVPVEAAVAPPAATAAPSTARVETVAALPPKIAPVPMPLSMRPEPVANVAPQAPLIINEPPPVIVGDPGPLVTADDLQGWETGPLSDFLAQRQRQGSSADYRVQPNRNTYQTDGFWLDEMPVEDRPQRFPPAYDDGYYVPFSR